MDNAGKLITWIQTPSHDVDIEFFEGPGLARRMVETEWPAVKSDIDFGRPSPLSLCMGPECGWFDIPGIISALGHCHQVLAYAYDLDDDNNLVLSVYDPNDPDDDNSTISLNIGNPKNSIKITAPEIEANLAEPFAIRGFFRELYRQRDPSLQLDAAVVGIATAPSGNGYWLVAADGGVFGFGLAPFFGSVPGVNPPVKLNKPVVGMAASPSGNGYWLAAADGGIFCFGAAQFFGSVPGMNPPIKLSKPVVGMAATPAGNGYWLAAADGGVFCFGAAPFCGSVPGLNPPIKLDKPVVGIVATPSGNGYWLTAADGGVFSFGDAQFFGSVPGVNPPIKLNKPVVGMAATPPGNGYWLAAADGGVFSFADAQFFGSIPGLPAAMFTA